MKKALLFLKKEPMLTISVLAAVIAMVITPPTERLLHDIDWRTLGTLLMMLCVLEGFKRENVLRPVVGLASRLNHMTSVSLFLIFGVFFTSMFVTNDVSLIIFVPLTILLFRNGNKEKYILPVITMENIAAIRGSMLMPFGSPQNLFLYGQADVSAWHFMLHMLPLCALSALLLIFDRLSPVLASLPLLGFPIGYLTGPRSRAMIHGGISSSNKRAQRKRKKAIKARQARTQKKNEII